MKTIINTTTVAEIEINYKSKVKPEEREKVSSSKDAAKVFHSIFNMNTIEHRESFWAMYLNRNAKVLGVLHISDGGVSGTFVDAKIIFQGALMLNASSIIVCHNHPSGILQPSHSDIQISKKLKEGAKLLDLEVLDSMIITGEGTHYSLADEGQI